MIPATFRFLCGCCARTVYMCRCYDTADTFGWTMRPEWTEARDLAQRYTDKERREAQRQLMKEIRQC